MQHAARAAPCALFARQRFAQRPALHGKRHGHGPRTARIAPIDGPRDPRSGLQIKIVVAQRHQNIVRKQSPALGKLRGKAIGAVLRMQKADRTVRTAVLRKDPRHFEPKRAPRRLFIPRKDGDGKPCGDERSVPRGDHHLSAPTDCAEKFAGDLAAADDSDAQRAALGCKRAVRERRGIQRNGALLLGTSRPDIAVQQTIDEVAVLIDDLNGHAALVHFAL